MPSHGINLFPNTNNWLVLITFYSNSSRRSFISGLNNKYQALGKVKFLSIAIRLIIPDIFYLHLKIFANTAFRPSFKLCMCQKQIDWISCFCLISLYFIYTHTLLIVKRPFILQFFRIHMLGFWCSCWFREEMQH